MDKLTTDEAAPQTGMKKIVVRKAGPVRLTRLCNNYCYGCCCCAGLLG